MVNSSLTWFTNIPSGNGKGEIHVVATKKASYQYRGGWLILNSLFFIIKWRYQAAKIRGCKKSNINLCPKWYDYNVQNKQYTK